MPRFASTTSVTLLLILITALSPSVRAAPSAKPATSDSAAQVKATAAADLAAVAPGGTVHLLVTLEMAEGVHVYWRNPGGSGLPTEIEWRGPKGYLFGRTQYPAPSAKFDEMLKETSWIHADTANFITPVKVPATAETGTTVKFQADVKWLACRKGICVPDGTTLTLELPVRAASAPASEEIVERFDIARAMAPVEPSAAEHLKLSVRTDKPTVKPGEEVTAIVTVEIAAKHHMQSEKPLEDYLIPALVFVEPIDGASIGKIAYPTSHIRNDPMLGKMSEYSGKVEFKIPIEFEKDGIGTQPRWLRGVLQSQICSDAGTCYPPQYIEFATPIRIEGGPAAAATPDTFEERVLSASTAAPPTNMIETKPVGEETVASSGGIIQRVQNWFIAKGYYGVLVLALLGGVILNLMPCVLPVISLKLLSYVKQANENRGRIFALGLAYCSGILVFFGIIAMLYYTSGRSWGEHFQNPYVVLVLAAVITAFALSLFGVFAVFSPKIINQLGVKAEQSEGLHSAFFTGVLATILGTACTGPFMSAALGAASQYSEIKGAMIFMAVGVGMMLPFLMLAMNPAWLKFVPKPGKWMETFEAVMGFILLATVIWIINPIRGQLGDWGLLLSLIFLLGVAAAVWLRGKAQFGSKNKLAFNIACVTMLGFAWAIPFRWLSSVKALAADRDEHRRIYNIGILTARTPNEGGELGALPTPQYPEDRIDWLPYDPALTKRFVDAGYTVFVDFTADWCATCKTNLSTSINVKSTRDIMREQKVIPLEADYSSRSPKLKKIINSYGRAGVPLYLVFSPHKPDDPQILAEILSSGMVADALKRAGPSRPEDRVASSRSPTGGEAPSNDP